MRIQDLDIQELIDIVELLNQVTLDSLAEPVEVIDFAMMKQRTKIIRTFLAIARGEAPLEKDLKFAQDFYDEES